MPLFTRTEAPMPAAVRGLTAELAAEADAAVEDGLRRDAPNTEEVLDAIASIKRYLNRKKWTVKVVYEGDEVHWTAIPMKERAPMSDEHKRKLHAARKKAAAAKAAAAKKATAPAA